MKQRARASSSSLFLMELILSILFFSITAAVCVQLFARVHLMTESSQSLNDAVNLCRSAENAICSANTPDGVNEALRAAFPDAVFSAENETDVSESAGSEAASVTETGSEQASEHIRLTDTLTADLTFDNNLLTAVLTYQNAENETDGQDTVAEQNDPNAQDRTDGQTNSNAQDEVDGQMDSNVQDEADGQNDPNAQDETDPVYTLTVEHAMKGGDL